MRAAVLRHHVAHVTCRHLVPGFVGPSGVSPEVVTPARVGREGYLWSLFASGALPALLPHVCVRRPWLAWWCQEAARCEALFVG